MLDEIFSTEVPGSLAARKKQAYGYAHFALGLLAYNRQEIGMARDHLLHALRFYPGVASQPRMFSTLLKTLLGERALNILRKQNATLKAGNG